MEFDVDRLLAGNIAQLQIEKQFFSSLTRHGPEIGRLNETHLVRMLRRYLPEKFGIGTGFLVSGGEDGTMSPVRHHHLRCAQQRTILLLRGKGVRTGWYGRPHCPARSFFRNRSRRMHCRKGPPARRAPSSSRLTRSATAAPAYRPVRRRPLSRLAASSHQP